ncbi:MAG: chitobiase/beta-hexosaminidase C-terminal domain-containing protein, partial [Lachnospiraceae bacterium]|nr:chitobiase/beta-hexosaminidase C-terminal domain-containing protein [Lachnospiraceae bacterium]
MKMKLKNRILAGLLSLAVVAGDLMPAYALGSEDEPVVAVESAEEQEAEMTVPLVREGAFPEAERFTPDATALATYFTPEAEAAVISALKSRATTIDISAYKVPKADVGKFYFGILNSHPDLFYVDGGFSYNYNDTYATKILPRYSTEYSQADIDLFYETVDRIIDSIDSDWSKLEKVLYLHDYLVTHCDYQKTQPYTKFNAYNALVEGDSVCQGYAEAFECLLQRIGVDGQVVTSEGINHAWNVLSLDGKWYYIDCTWDDPLGRCGPYCGHSNLLRSREGMTETGHTSTDWVGAEDSSNIYGTIPGATTYDSYFWSEIDSVLPLVGHKTMIVTETSGMFYDFSTKNSDVFSITTSSWPVKGNPYSHWVGTYSNVVAVNGVFYYSTCDSIYSCTTSKEQEKVYELSSSELSKGYIYGLSAEDPYVKYWLKTSPNDSEYAATGKTKVSSSTPKTKAATPTASPASGATLEVGDQISLSCATSGARIYYTTDGSAPSTSSTLYTAKISVPASCAGDSFTIKAIAVADGYLNSAVGSFTYTVEELPVLEQAPAPAASPASGTVLKVGDTIRLSSTLEDAQIRYTTDGSNPTETSALYGSAIIVSEESAGSVFTVKAIVTAEGYLASDVASFAYIVEEEEPEQTAAPVASPVSGTTLSAGDAVSLSCATEGAVIRYTTDGSSPTAASALYESPIIVPASSAGTNFTIKAIAYGEGCVASEEAVFIYPVREDPVEEKTSAPTADPESGTLLEVGDSISLNCVSENALIYYTTDGSEPDESATVYTEPIVVSESFAGKDLTIKAFAVAEDLPASNIAIFVYSVKAITPSEQTAAPVATPASGSSLMSGDTITLSCTTANAKIYYTTDGTLPTEASTLYGSPIEITDEMAGTTVKIRAIAVAEGYLASNAVIFVYTVEAKPSDEKTAAPKADPADGTGVAAGDEIVLSCATEGAKIYYTTKEGTPIGKYTYYIAPITIPESYEGKNFTIKAYAVADPLPESAVVSFTYPVISKTSAPVAAPASGSRLGVGDTVKLSCATEGAVIHYTIGADNAVSETSPVYSEPIAVTLDMIGTTLTINALAVGKDQPASTAVSFSYTVEDRSKIELDKKSIRFTSLDKTEILTAKVYGPDGKIDDKAEVTFESKDPSVATVSANGTVIPVANGKTVVTARSGKLSADCAVSVFLTGIEEEEIPVYRVDFYNDKLLLKSSDVQRGSYVKDIPEVDNLAYWYDNDLGAVWNASSPVTKDLTLYA